MQLRPIAHWNVTLMRARMVCTRAYVLQCKTLCPVAKYCDMRELVDYFILTCSLTKRIELRIGKVKEPYANRKEQMN